MMFIRRLKHKSGITYIQVVEKIYGKYKVRKSFGGCHTDNEIVERELLAQQWVKEALGLRELDFNNEVQAYENVLNSITSHKLIGIELVLGKIFDQIGFNQIKDPLFRDLVLYRLVYPKSKDKITSLKLKNGESTVINKDNLRLIITFTESRAKKDRYNREKGVRRLEKQLKQGKLTKSNINNRGYNKFLQMNGEISLSINRDKIIQDQKWDGLKGYITNSELDKDELLDNYGQLWLIEKAFRVAKSELKLRPIYHYKRRRIEAHICLNFAAYKVYKELERQLKVKKSSLSPEKVIEILQSIYQIELSTTITNEKIRKTLILTEEHRKLSKIFDFGC